MPYVQGFNNDIFISFAHTDDADGWVETFHARLKARLTQLGVSVCVWRDTKLQGTDVFSDEIFDHLKSSALLVSIISPAGVNSSWCQDERQKFEQFAELNGGFRIKNTLRAIKVVKTPLDNDAHRELFSTLGFEFYERDEQTQGFQEFDPTSPEYRQMLDRLAQDIRRVLDVLRNRDVSTATKLNVYVAAASKDLENEREAIVRQVEDWGYSVLPASSSGLAEMSDLRSKLNADLGKSILSVHLVSKQRGAIPEGEEKSIVALQYDLAQSRPVDRIVWISPGSQPDQSVSKSIEEGRQQGVEILEGRTIEDLKEVIEARLKRLRDESSLLQEGRNKYSVYIVCDRKDHPYLNESEGRNRALQLKSYLDSKGYVVWLPPVTPMEETRRRKDHRETLKLSDAVLIYWGAADEVWFRESLRELIKARTRRSGCRYLAEAAFFGNPQLSEKSHYRNQLDLVFEQFDDFNPEALQPLFQRLQ
jgi:TIR domain